jgi:hypothetical protein
LIFNLGNNYNRNQNYGAGQGKELFMFGDLFIVLLGSLSLGNQKLFPPNLTNYYSNNVNPQFRQYPIVPNMNYNPNLQQQGYGQLGPNGGIGFLVSIIDRYLNDSFISREVSKD